MMDEIYYKNDIKYIIRGFILPNNLLKKRFFKSVIIITAFIYIFRKTYNVVLCKTKEKEFVYLL